jgi:hypothetical protein
MRANVTVLPYDDRDRDVKLLHSLDCTVWSEKVEAILELGDYETRTMDELYSKLKSSEVDRGVRAKIENPTDPIVSLSCLGRGLTVTCLVGSFLFLVLCPCQMRSLMCWARIISRCWAGSLSACTRIERMSTHGRHIFRRLSGTRTTTSSSHTHSSRMVSQSMLIWVKVLSLYENYINYMHNMLRLIILCYHEYYLKSN